MMAASYFYFFFNDTATTEIYTLSLHDALPICLCIPQAFAVEIPYIAFLTIASTLSVADVPVVVARNISFPLAGVTTLPDRKSTRLNSSHANISYAVFCLKKKTSHSIHVRAAHL